MPKKTLKIDFTVNLQNDDATNFDDVQELNMGTTEFYEQTRAYLKTLFPNSDMENATLVTFKSVDQDLDDIQ